VARGDWLYANYRLEVVDKLLGASRKSVQAPVPPRQTGDMPVVIPDELIAVQAYVIWEQSGKPQVGGGYGREGECCESSRHSSRWVRGGREVGWCVLNLVVQVPGVCGSRGVLCGSRWGGGGGNGGGWDVVSGVCTGAGGGGGYPRGICCMWVT
jgi:hypothetical protein